MKFKRYNIIPLVLTLYLLAMAIIGLPELYAGHYLYYFGIIGVTLACILALRLLLKKRYLLKDSGKKGSVKKR